VKSLFLSLFILFLFSACSFRNPFIPPSSGTIYETSASYPSEPITTKAMYRATMKPYTVQGIRYTPIMPHVGQIYQGTASWYGPNFHGNKTSNGEYYDMHENTAAHKTLPMNTLLKVTHLNTGAYTIVRVNDRGPFVDTRIIDLSYQAALEIGMIQKGTARVRLEVLELDETSRAYAHKPQAVETITPMQTEPAQESPQAGNRVVYKVQIVSTQNKEKAQALVSKYAIIDGKYSASLKTKTFWQKTHYKVLIGDFTTADEAQNFIADHAFNGAFVVKE